MRGDIDDRSGQEDLNTRKLERIIPTVCNVPCPEHHEVPEAGERRKVVCHVIGIKAKAY